jgi:hypothetical protein
MLIYSVQHSQSELVELRIKIFFCVFSLIGLSYGGSERDSICSVFLIHHKMLREKYPKKSLKK